MTERSLRSDRTVRAIRLWCAARPESRALPIVLAALGLLLFATAVPGIFIIDEHSYISTIAGLRAGSLRLPHTAGLPPSPELLSFDAAPLSRRLTETPASPNTPPLYAVVALPFSYFGVRGLIALQVLSFVVCAFLVFRVVRRETQRVDLAWLALATWAVGGFAIEYAQAIWPHATTMALVMGAVDLASRLRRDEPGRRRVFLYAALAGACVGLAAGMRYQNIVIVVMLGAAMSAWIARRRLAIAGYLLGVAIPLAASASMNASRLGSWNPVSKGGRYLEVGRSRGIGEGVEQAFTSTWARVVDFTVWPPPAPPSGDTPRDAQVPKSDSGAFLLLTGIKKAVLQSAPWVLLAVCGLALSWSRRSKHAPPNRSLLRGFSVIVAGVLGMFALYGSRYDGWCFNQRYLLELMPILATTIAIVLVDWAPRWWLLASGGILGVLLGAVAAYFVDEVSGQIALMKVPLLIAVVLVTSWLARNRWPACARVFAATLGIALGWAAAVHLFSDLPASRLLRAHNSYKLESMARAVPHDDTPIAIFAYWGTKDAYGPLLLERDVVIVDPWIDSGRDATMLLERLLQQGRLVYIDRTMPPRLLAALTANRRAEVATIPWLMRIRP